MTTTRSSSSSDDASSGDESDELEEVEVRAWDADLPPTHDTVEGSVEAARLAVTDQEWKHCRPAGSVGDAPVALPAGRRSCSRVAVYASEYGAREMEREEKFGPGGIFADDAPDASSDSGSEDEAEEGFDAEKLRAYELKNVAAVLRRRSFPRRGGDGRGRLHVRRRRRDRSDVRAPEPVVHPRRDDLRRRAEARRGHVCRFDKPPKAR